MTSLDGISLNKYYLEATSRAQDQAYRAARGPALATPLEKGTVLAWNGPNLHPDTLPPSDYPHNNTPEPSPNPPRPLLPFLLASNSPSQGGTGWSLKLREALKTGEDRWSQVWRCEIVAPQSSQTPLPTVVLKLRHQTLFPLPADRDSHPEFDSWNWYPAEHLVRREELAYSQLRPYQGRDLPLCYGFYTFDLPSNETVVGVILEDLSEDTIPLSTFFQREKAANRIALDNVLPIAHAAFQLQHRLQNGNTLGICNLLHDILATRQSLHSPQPNLVALSLGHTVPMDIQAAASAAGRDSDDEDEEEEGEEQWRERDHDLLDSAFATVLHGKGGFWRFKHLPSLFPSSP